MRDATGFRHRQWGTPARGLRGEPWGDTTGAEPDLFDKPLVAWRRSVSSPRSTLGSAAGGWASCSRAPSASAYGHCAARRRPVRPMQNAPADRFGTTWTPSGRSRSFVTSRASSRWQPPTTQPTSPASARKLRLGQDAQCPARPEASQADLVRIRSEGARRTVPTGWGASWQRASIERHRPRRTGGRAFDRSETRRPDAGVTRSSGSSTAHVWRLVSDRLLGFEPPARLMSPSICAGGVAGVGIDVAVSPRDLALLCAPSAPADSACRSKTAFSPSPPRSRAGAPHPGNRRPPGSQSPRRAERETAPAETPPAAAEAADTAARGSRRRPLRCRAAAPPRTDTAPPRGRSSETRASADNTSRHSAR